jgi:hypothetical protein
VGSECFCPMSRKAMQEPDLILQCYKMHTLLPIVYQFNVVQQLNFVRRHASADTHLAETTETRVLFFCSFTSNSSTSF